MEQIIADYLHFGWIYLIVILMCASAAVLVDSTWKVRTPIMVSWWIALDIALHHL